MMIHLGQSHQHVGALSSANLALLLLGAGLVVVVLVLVFRRPRIRDGASGRWKLPDRERATDK